MRKQFFIFNIDEGEVIIKDTEEEVIEWLNDLDGFEADSLMIVEGVSKQVRLGIRDSL